MWARGGSIGLIVFCVLMIVLCWQATGRAATTPPTIDQIVGTYSVTDKEVYYYFDKADCGQCHSLPEKANYSLTWYITKLSDSTVQVSIDGGEQLFTAYYSNGLLVQSYQDGAGGFAMGIATFSGKPGKIKFKGDFGWGQYNVGEDYYGWDPYSGKMTSAGPGLTVGAPLASRCHGQTVFMPGEGEVPPLAAAPPLAIDDLPGTYSCILTSTVYHPTAGTKEKQKEPDTLTITKIDDSTLNLHSSGGDMYTHYGSGVLMLVDIDGTVLDADALLGMLLAKGKPGKISLKGKVYAVSGLGTPNDKFKVSSVSCKQSSP
ncbi:MAG: hypothetical protein ACXWMJ_06415 [Syntrophales bacterium]